MSKILLCTDECSGSDLAVITTGRTFLVQIRSSSSLQPPLLWMTDSVHVYGITSLLDVSAILVYMRSNMIACSFYVLVPVTTVGDPDPLYFRWIASSCLEYSV